MSPRQGRRNNIIYLRLSLSPSFRPTTPGIVVPGGCAGQRGGLAGWLNEGWARPPFPTYLPAIPLTPNPRVVSRLPLELRQYLRFRFQRRYHVRERAREHTTGTKSAGDETVNFDFSNSANSYGTTSPCARDIADSRKG